VEIIGKVHALFEQLSESADSDRRLSPDRRHFDDLEAVTSTKQTCELVRASRATPCRRRRPPVLPPLAPRPAPANNLTAAERQHILALLHSPEYCDLATARCGSASSTTASTCAP
jgi:hypothetical protein